jgi:hypothetical protein
MNRYRKLAAFLTITLICLTSTANSASASSTVFGNSGLVYIPTDDTTLVNTVDLSLSLMTYDNALGDLGFGEHSHIVGLRYGLFPQVEVGAATFQDLSGEQRIIAHGKIVLLPELGDSPASVTVGVWDPFNTHDASAYFVVGKNFLVKPEDAPESAFELGTYLGFGGGIYRHEVFGGGRFKFAGGFALSADTVGGEVNFSASYETGKLTLEAKLLDTNEAVFGATVRLDL